MTGAHACGKSKAKLANPGVLHADPLPGRKDSSTATDRAPPDPESRQAGSGNCEACGQEGGTGRRRLHAPFVSTLPQMTGAESLRAARVSLSAGSSLTPRGERPTRQRPFPCLSPSPLAPTTTPPAQPWAQAFICTWPATNELGCRATCTATPGPGRTAPLPVRAFWSVRQRAARPTHLRPGWRVRPPVRPALVGRPARGNAELLLLLLLHSACVGERPGERAAQACADVDVCVRVCKCECCVCTRVSGEGGLRDHRFPAPPIIPAHVYPPLPPPPPPRCTACPGSRVQDLPPRLV